MVSYMDPCIIIMIRILNIVGFMSGTSGVAQQLQDICIHQFAKARFWQTLCLKISHIFKKYQLWLQYSVLLQNNIMVRLSIGTMLCSWQFVVLGGKFIVCIQVCREICPIDEHNFTYKTCGVLQHHKCLVAKAGFGGQLTLVPAGSIVVCSINRV